MNEASMQIEDQDLDEVAENEDQPEAETDDQKAEAQGDESEGEDIAADDADEDEEDGELVVTIGDESAEPEDTGAAPKWVKDLRKKHRETQRELREAKALLARQQQSAPVEKLPPKPTLRDMDYDDGKFEAALIEWHEKKRQHDERQKSEQAKAEKEKEAYNSKLMAYNAAKTEMRVRDFDDAESVVSDMMDTTKQGIIISGAENPAHVVYALGRHPDHAKRLAEIEDPIQFAFAVAKMEAQLKVSPRKAKAPPEKKMSGTGRVSGTVDNTLDRLRDEAMRTGDMSKVMAYKRKQRQKG